MADNLEKRKGRQPGPLATFFQAALREHPGLTAEEALRGAAKAGLDVRGAKAQPARQAFGRARRAVLGDAAPPAGGAAERPDDLGALLLAKKAADGVGGVERALDALRMAEGCGGTEPLRALLDAADGVGLPRMRRCLLVALELMAPPASGAASP